MKISTVITLVIALTVTHAINAEDLYVDAVNGNDLNDGLSWETALQTISVALDTQPEPDDIIHVTAGSYCEEIHLSDGVSLQGGYPPGGGLPDPEIYLSVINGEKVRRCVNGAESALLKGFTLINGYARSGGGVHHSNVSMTVDQCVIKDCVATGGTPFGGGAMYFYLSSSLITRCHFENNSVQIAPDSDAGEAMGGAIMVWASSPTLQNCTFIDNQVLENETADLRLGGAIWASASSLIVQNCLFQDNAAVTAGAIGWWNRTIPLIEDCQFIDNRATGLGGAICHIYNESAVAEQDLWVRNCQFTGNTAELGGGILISRNNRVILSNCLFHDNYALDTGSAIAIDSSYCRISHCTIAHNNTSVSGETGGAIYLNATSTTEITDTIVSDNAGVHGIELETGGNPLAHTLHHTNVYGHAWNYSHNYVDRTLWNHNQSADPLFVSSDLDDYCLSEPATGDASQNNIGTSPCIDSASHSSHGYSEAYASTRTDLMADGHQADLGWHRKINGLTVMADAPYAGEYAVPLDSSIRCHLVNVPWGTSTDEITATLNDQPVDCFITTSSRGYEIELTSTSLLSLNTLYTVEISVEIFPATRTFSYIFSTEPKPDLPPSPEGNGLEVSFPMIRGGYAPGDDLAISVQYYNPWLNDVTVDLCTGFEFAGQFYFFPLWSTELQRTSLRAGPGQEHTIELIAFEVPADVTPCGPFTFYALCLASESMEIASNLASWELNFIP